MGNDHNDCARNTRKVNTLLSTQDNLLSIFGFSVSVYKK